MKRRSIDAESDKTFLNADSSPGKNLYDPAEVILKRTETQFPERISFKDKTGHEPADTRVRWYADPADQTFDSCPMVTEIGIDISLARE